MVSMTEPTDIELLDRWRTGEPEAGEALCQLPVEQQTLLELHYWEDMDIANLAEVFEMPPTTIRTRLHRARKALRERMSGDAPRRVLETLETMDVWARGLSRRAET